MRLSAWLVSNAIVLTGVSSHVIGSTIETRAPFLKLLATRQDPANPQCTSQCSEFENALNTCADETCICTEAIANALNTCVTCAYENRPEEGVLASSNDLIQNFQSACASFNLPVNPRPIGGGGASISAPITQPTQGPGDVPPVASQSTPTPSPSPPTPASPSGPSTVIETVIETGLHGGNEDHGDHGAPDADANVPGNNAASHVEVAGFTALLSLLAVPILSLVM